MRPQNVEDLPDELLLEILSFVKSEYDLRTLQFVNSHFRRLSLDNELWKRVFCDKYGLDPYSTVLWSDLLIFVQSLESTLDKEQFSATELRYELGLTNMNYEHRERENEALKFKVDRLRTDLDIASEDHHSDQQLIASLRDLVDMQKARIEELDADVTSYRQKLTLETENSSKMTSKLEYLELELNSEREAHKPLRKEILELRLMWEKDLKEIDRYKSEARKREKQLEGLVNLNREKTRELDRACDQLERNAREERLKRAVLERRLTGLNLQLTEDTENFSKQAKINRRETEKIKKDAEADYENILELRRQNRDLERELKRKTEYFEQEISRIKKLFARANKGSALSFQVMAKA